MLVLCASCSSSDQSSESLRSGPNALGLNKKRLNARQLHLPAATTYFCHAHHAHHSTIPRPPQLIDYGYIRDTEVDSDDELDDEEVEQSQGGSAPTPPTADPSPSEGPAGDEVPQQLPAETQEKGEGGSESVELPSPTNVVPASTAGGSGKSAEGDAVMKFGPKRMFMDEVRR